MERIEKRETLSLKNQEALSLQLQPPANLNHRGTDLFVPGLAESSAFRHVDKPHIVTYCCRGTGHRGFPPSGCGLSGYN
ncbi:hypothetical protein CHARACLAT_023899 [Characodon lateralis]|uniref:Uncharacterized protein n=1 Tax=Characodon lateralis TaxID=208331 RepID=A0ABU7EYT1_9TELE|nr:hypothetical protein [Characodon lateralis]